MKYIFLVFLVLIFGACSSKQTVVEKKEPQKEPKKKVRIYDLENIPQSVDFYTNDLNSSIKIYDIQKKYEKYYFNVWNNTKPRETLSDIKWPFNSYKAGNSYGENLQLIEQSFFDEMLYDANFGDFATLNAKAITLVDVSIRAFPTNKPLLRDPNKAGEGFPFDYLQNSTLHANKPLFISHYSKDKEWVYAFSSFASGWIKSNEIVFLKEEHIDKWKKAQQIFFIKDNIPLYSKDGSFLFHSKIGTILPLISESENSFTVLAISSYKNSEPFFESIEVSKSIARKKPLTFNKNNLSIIMNEVFKSNYGWGGMYGQRDCSSMLRDMYAPFGIWLPRNSSQQAKIGKIIKLNGLNDEEKVATIKEKAIPFLTFLYKKGHIVLYVGTFNNEIVIFHNTWGIKTKKDGIEGRVIIGKTIFSSLRLGKELQNYDADAEMLKNLKSLNSITQ